METLYHYIICIHRGRDGYMEISSKDNGANPLTGTMQQIVEVIRQHFQPHYFIAIRDNVTQRLIACVGSDQIIRDGFATEVGRISPWKNPSR